MCMIRAMLARLARVALVLVLLSVWTGALLHPLVHADATGRLVHLHDDPKSSGQADPRCDVLASLGACLPGGPAAGMPAIQALAASFPAPLLVHGGEAPPFFAQGPPARL